MLVNLYNSDRVLMINWCGFSFAVGKLPASSMSDEKLKILRKYEKEKLNELLSKYIAFCGKARV